MWDFKSHYNQNEIDFNRVRRMVSVVAAIKFCKREEMALVGAISSP